MFTINKLLLDDLDATIGKHIHLKVGANGVILVPTTNSML